MPAPPGLQVLCWQHTPSCCPHSHVRGGSCDCPHFTDRKMRFGNLPRITQMLSARGAILAQATCLQKALHPSICQIVVVCHFVSLSKWLLRPLAWFVEAQTPPLQAHKPGQSGNWGEVRRLSKDTLWHWAGVESGSGNRSGNEGVWGAVNRLRSGPLPWGELHLWRRFRGAS